MLFNKISICSPARFDGNGLFLFNTKDSYSATQKLFILKDLIIYGFQKVFTWASNYREKWIIQNQWDVWWKLDGEFFRWVVGLPLPTMMLMEWGCVMWMEVDDIDGMGTIDMSKGCDIFWNVGGGVKYKVGVALEMGCTEPFTSYDFFT